MTIKIHGKQTRVWIDEFDASGMLNSATISNERDIADASTFVGSDGSEDTKDYIGGKTTHKVSTSGFLDVHDTDSTWESIASDRYDTGAQAVVGIFTGDARGDRCYESVALSTGKPETWGITGPVGLNTDWQGDNLAYGIALSYKQVVSATGALTGAQFKELAANDILRMVVRISAKTGTGNFAAKVQHSTDSTNGTDGTWNDVTGLASATLTGVDTDTDTATAAGTLGPWFRLNVTTLTLTNVTLTSSVGKQFD